MIIPCVAQSGEFDPWNFRPTVMEKTDKAPGDLSFPALLIYQGTVFFSRFISPIDGDRCAMYPTCSHYSRQAIAKHGFLVGYVLTVDRLLHENNEVDIAEEVQIGGSERYHDPVENNDFWWYNHR